MSTRTPTTEASDSETRVGVLRHRGTTLARRKARTAYLFVLPQVFGLLAFTLIPLLVSAYLSFTHWDLVADSPTWVGLGNWKHLLNDVRIPNVIWNTVKFILVGTTSFLVFSLMAALMTFTPRRGVGLYRAALFMPYVLSQISVGIVWRWMLNGHSGPVSAVFDALFGSSPDWLLNSATAMPSIALVTTWQTVGYGMTLYISALQSVPTSVVEAAKIDGANWWQRFRYITLPLISPTAFFLMVTSLIGAFQLFDPVVAMTSIQAGPATAGGPSNSTNTIVLYLYNQMFNYNEQISGMGYASTIAWILAAFIFFITMLQFFGSKRWVHYGNEGTGSGRRKRRRKA